MRLFLFLFALITLTHGFMSCKSGGGPATFCDTSCLKDTIKFIKEDDPLQPFVYISAGNCNADTLIRGYKLGGLTRRVGFPQLVGTNVKINKSAISCYIKDTSYAWLAFNDCSTGRGFLLKLPFGRTADISRKSSAINRFDPRFLVDEKLICYSDRGNIFVEDMESGKQAMMTFGQKLDIDYDAIHEYIDSVRITPTHIWTKVRFKPDGEWQIKQKTIELK